MGGVNSSKVYSELDVIEKHGVIVSFRDMLNDDKTNEIYARMIDLPGSPSRQVVKLYAYPDARSMKSIETYFENVEQMIVFIRFVTKRNFIIQNNYFMAQERNSHGTIHFVY